MQLSKEMVYANLTYRLCYATINVNVVTKYPLPIIILSLRQCISILRQADVGREEYRTQKRSHAKGSILGQRDFSNPHLPKIFPVPSCEEMNIDVRISSNIHYSVLGVYSSVT